MQNIHETVYISGAISGIPDYMERFALAERKLTAAGYKVFNPARAVSIINNLRALSGKRALTYAECMKYCLNRLINDCTAISMLPCWEKSDGARTEKAVADSLKYREVTL
jgi:hypothetical protein